MKDTEKIKFIESAVEHLFERNIKIKPDDKLLDLGLDSLDIVELQMYYEDEYETIIESDDSPITVRDLMGLMQ